MVLAHEVKKALAICKDRESNCNECQYFGTAGVLCIDKLIEDALVLINQQKAEIDRLIAERKDNDST